ncbi:MAG: calcium-binding protein, partial [Deltaproteobacteria bacterium]|nr:calcium-binding protein [Deltaproteobacteria bacterium]
MGKQNSLKEWSSLPLWSLLTAALVCSLLLMLSAFSYASGDSLCAMVKIEITQDLTLERQAFEAHMRISNGLSHITLENVDVDVVFSDEEGNRVLASSNPDNTDALFFIRVDEKVNIDDVDGAGTVGPSSAADIYWLIIPAPGCSNGLESGTLYYVGATLTYTMGGEEQITEVTPDYIFVKPMPELTLDYFLPTEVYGDDVFSSEIEPPVPFSLGTRVKNNGFGVARSLKIDSAQPKIVENDQGLLIDFVITDCEVNGHGAAESLLADFGDLKPNASAVARWQMSCSLSGSFVEFTTDFSHADELGGELTSLLAATNSHILVHDVLVDLTGRDAIRDFLAKDNDVYRIYESDGVDTEVLNQSAAAAIQFTGQYGTESHYFLSLPATPGFMYVRIPDPYNGEKGIDRVIRSDGKYLKIENFWLSKSRDVDHNWQYFVNLFDVKTTASYAIVFADVAVTPQAPVLQFIPDRSGDEGEVLSFIIEASDPDGTIPGFSAAPLPAGAGFLDQGDGRAVFTWTPAEGQAGSYEITFKATDGILEDSRRVVLTIYSSADSDGDGMLDDWEMQYFATLDREGAGDFDGDGIVDLNEYLYGTDPTTNENAPGIPLIQSPLSGAEVNMLPPELVVENSIDPDGDPIFYEFELYADAGMNSLIAGAQVSEVPGNTSWTISEELVDNSHYYWRVRATDGTAYSLWSYDNFFVNTENDSPGIFRVSAPQNDAEVDTVTPILEVSNAGESDEDLTTYTFEVYADSGMSTMVASAAGLPAGTGGVSFWRVIADPPLIDQSRYYWRALAVDEHGAQTESSLVSFQINCSNAAPGAHTIVAPANYSEVSQPE